MLSFVFFFFVKIVYNWNCGNKKKERLEKHMVDLPIDLKSYYKLIAEKNSLLEWKVPFG